MEFILSSEKNSVIVYFLLLQLLDFWQKKKPRQTVPRLTGTSTPPLPPWLPITTVCVCVTACARAHVLLRHLHKEAVTTTIRFRFDHNSTALRHRLVSRQSNLVTSTRTIRRKASTYSSRTSASNTAFSTTALRPPM